MGVIVKIFWSLLVGELIYNVQMVRDDLILTKPYILGT